MSRHAAEFRPEAATTRMMTTLPPVPRSRHKKRRRGDGPLKGLSDLQAALLLALVIWVPVWLFLSVWSAT